jgi:methionine synthase I (cobalamin-dependent)
MNPIEKIINQKGYCVADGATGSNLFQRGLESGDPPDFWCIDRPDDILWLHDQFISAGSDLILTNSFGANRLRLKLHDAQDRVREINLAAARLARQAADASLRDIVVAGSIGPTGELFEPMGALTHDSTVQVFFEQAEALVEGGADVLWIETMSSKEEVFAAVQACKMLGVPVCATMTFDTAKKTMMGVTPAEYVRFAEEIGLDACGANCGIGLPELMHSTLEMLDVEDHFIPIIAKGNCGIPEYIDGEIHWGGDPEMMAQYGLFARDAGAEIIGGCCGTTPEHIKAMVDALKCHPYQDFDKEKMVETLGTPWKDLPTETKPRKRRRSRSTV